MSKKDIRSNPQNSVSPSNRFCTPSNFDKYRPRVFEKLTDLERYELGFWIEPVLAEMDDSTLLILLLYFSLGMDVRTIQAFCKVEKARGQIEVFRFQAKQHLERDKPISDIDMRDVFRDVAATSEVILITGGRGVCLFSPKIVPESLALSAAKVSEKRKTK